MIQHHIKEIITYILVIIARRESDGKFVLCLSNKLCLKNKGRSMIHSQYQKEQHECELFYVCYDDIQDITLYTALSGLVAIFMEGLKTEASKIADAVKNN